MGRSGKVSRWDRPPAPRNFRWLIRSLGLGLVGFGVLIVGFVAFQLWGTGIENAQSQNRLRDSFEEYLAEAGVAVTAPEIASGTVEPLAPPTPGPASVAAEPLDFSYVADEGWVGSLWIPAADINNQMVVSDITDDHLREGPGHFPNTAFPGELGNAAFAGHRVTWGGPFDRLPNAEIGDPIAISTPNGTFTYRVTGNEIVHPTETRVLATADPTRATLTLITCHPRSSTEFRFVLYAELVPELSDPVGAYAGRGALAPNQQPGDANLDPEPGTTEAGSTQNSTTQTDTAAAAIALPSENVGDGGTWFRDRGGFRAALGWGALGVATVMLAYLVAKRFRNSWIGVAVGIVPLMITLYFFYQNVNRVVPASL